MSVNLDVSELTDLASDLADAPPTVDGLTSEQLTEIAGQLRDDARDLAPVDQGDLRASIRVLGGKDWRKVVADDEAAFYQEFGTSDTAPQPFMWPAARTADERMAEALEEIGVEALTRFR